MSAYHAYLGCTGHTSTCWLAVECWDLVTRSVPFSQMLCLPHSCPAGTGESQLVILDARDVEQGPVAVLQFRQARQEGPPDRTGQQPTTGGDLSRYAARGLVNCLLA